MYTGLIQNHRPDLENVPAPVGLTFQESNFALNLLQGFVRSEAYRRAFVEKCVDLTDAQISRAAYKLHKKDGVRKYLRALSKELERAAVATALELEMFLSAAIFTPISEIDENHPLCQKKKITTRTDKDGGETETIDLESVSKMDAIKTLVRMKGYDAPIKVDVNHNHGVMLVPMAASVEDWEKSAIDAQRRLMEDAIDV
jgi:hypothetical protein